jgi:hypothetical protein
MGKPRWVTLLVTLTLLVTATSIVGHFANDAICVVLDAGGEYECAMGQVSNGRSDSVSPIISDLHSSFDLPSALPALSLIVLAFVLVAITLTYPPYFFAPSPPPPKPRS